MRSAGEERQRSFLFLQGMATQFFDRLGGALTKRGHKVRRVNFNGGDWLFWRRSGAINFRGGLDSWPQFLEERLSEFAVTDIILFGDCRPLHRKAIRIAILRGVQVHVFDEGYIRPNWVTLEQGGVNGNSSLPCDPEWFRKTAADLPPWDGGAPVRGSFARRAIEDVAYNVATVLLAWRFPKYQTHRPWHPFVEYGGWLRRFAGKPFAKRRIAQGLAQLAESQRRYFVFALQLDCDSQIRQHSPLGRIAPALEQVIQSFARHASPDVLLVIKEHPLDNALTNWRKLTKQIAEAAGVADRIIYLEGGLVEPLIERSQGLVTINSTVGFWALSAGCPVATLGIALYDMPGLTFQSGIDRFWTSGQPPDPLTFDAFRRVVVARAQINGGFFSRAGSRLAVASAVKRLEDSAQNRSVSSHAPASVWTPAEEQVEILRQASLA